MPIHKNYKELTDEERDFVDDVVANAFHRRKVRHPEIDLDGGDGAERVVEALATWIIESRPK